MIAASERCAPADRLIEMDPNFQVSPHVAEVCAILNDAFSPLETAKDGDPVGVQATVISLGDMGIFVLSTQMMLWKDGEIILSDPAWQPWAPSPAASVYPALLAATQRNYQRLFEASNISISTSGPERGFDMLAVQVFRSGVLIVDNIHLQEYCDSDTGPEPSEVRSRNAIIVSSGASAHQWLAEHPSREALFRIYDCAAVPEEWRGKVRFRRPSASQSVLNRA